jgi:NADPH:quinone reductase-like Zn-dependent oxidoreductase
VKSLGADQAFDYNDPDCGRKIKEATNGKLAYAWDCVGQASSAKICSEALSSTSPARYGTIGNARLPRRDVNYSSMLAYTCIGETFEKFGQRFESTQTYFDFAQMWATEAVKYIESGQVKVHPISLRKDGLKGALKGMAEMKHGNYSGEKLVFRIDETP